MTSTETTETHTCPMCSKTFKTAGGLRTHGRTHRGEGIAAEAPTITAQAATGSTRRPSTAPKDGDIACTGPCGETKAVTKFPTYTAKDGTVARRTVCRSCRDAARRPRSTAA